MEPYGAPRLNTIINVHSVKVLHDTGYTIGLLVDPTLVMSQTTYTEMRIIMLAEGTQRIIPTAYVHIQSKYVNGRRVPAVCLPGCVTQSIMGYEYILQENGTKTENSDICVITM